MAEGGITPRVVGLASTPSLKRLSEVRALNRGIAEGEGLPWLAKATFFARRIVEDVRCSNRAPTESAWSDVEAFCRKAEDDSLRPVMRRIVGTTQSFLKELPEVKQNDLSRRLRVLQRELHGHCQALLQESECGAEATSPEAEEQWHLAIRELTEALCDTARAGSGIGFKCLTPRDGAISSWGHIELVSKQGEEALPSWCQAEPAVRQGMKSRDECNALWQTAVNYCRTLQHCLEVSDPKALARPPQEAMAAFPAHIRDTAKEIGTRISELRSTLSARVALQEQLEVTQAFTATIAALLSRLTAQVEAADDRFEVEGGQEPLKAAVTGVVAAAEHLHLVLSQTPKTPKASKTPRRTSSKDSASSQQRDIPRQGTKRMSMTPEATTSTTVHSLAARTPKKLQSAQPRQDLDEKTLRQIVADEVRRELQESSLSIGGLQSSQTVPNAQAKQSLPSTLHKGPSKHAGTCNAASPEGALSSAPSTTSLQQTRSAGLMKGVGRLSSAEVKDAKATVPASSDAVSSPVKSKRGILYPLHGIVQPGKLCMPPRTPRAQHSKSATVMQKASPLTGVTVATIQKSPAAERAEPAQCTSPPALPIVRRSTGDSGKSIPTRSRCTGISSEKTMVFDMDASCESYPKDRHTMKRSMTTPAMLHRSVTPSSSRAAAAGDWESCTENLSTKRLSSSRIEHLEEQFSRAKRLTRAATTLFEVRRTLDSTSPRRTGPNNLDINAEGPNGTPKTGAENLTFLLSPRRRCRTDVVQQLEEENVEVMSTTHLDELSMERDVEPTKPVQESSQTSLHMESASPCMKPTSLSVEPASLHMEPTSPCCYIDYYEMEVRTASPCMESATLPIKPTSPCTEPTCMSVESTSPCEATLRSQLQQAETATPKTGGLSALAILASPARVSRHCEERISLALLSLCGQAQLNSTPVLVPGN